MKFKKRLKLPEEVYDEKFRSQAYPQNVFDREFHYLLNDIRDLKKLEPVLVKHKDEPLDDPFIDALNKFAAVARRIDKSSVVLKMYLVDFCGYDEVLDES